MKYAVLGGDRRALSAASQLAKLGNSVRLWGCEFGDGVPDVTFCCDWRNAINGCDAVVLPLPASLDGVHINAGDKKSNSLSISELAEMLPTGIPVLGGYISSELYGEAKKNGIKLYDYYKDERLMMLNAQASAEGALMCAMSGTDIVLCGSRTAIVGYGRIAKLLARYMRAIGADVSVFARKPEVRAEAFANGCRAFRFSDGRIDGGMLSEFDIIVNTVPCRIITRDALEQTKRNALLIELASLPGGFSPDDARELGIHAVWAQGLPGRYAPVSAGIAIAESIVSLTEGEAILW